MQRSTLEDGITHRNRIKSTFWSIILLLGVFALSIAAPANSQEITGAVAVTATDGTGASVSGAQLTLTRTATGERITGVTHEDGSYTYPSLQPGTYTLSVIAPGFKSARFTNINGNIGEHVGILFTWRLVPFTSQSSFPRRIYRF